MTYELISVSHSGLFPLRVSACVCVRMCVSEWVCVISSVPLCVWGLFEETLPAGVLAV